MKKIALIIFLLTQVNLAAKDITIVCNKAKSIKQCRKSATDAIKSIGCFVDERVKAKCTSEGGFSCDIDSLNCFEPTQGAWSESCPSDSKMKTFSRKFKVDRGFGYGIATSIFGYSRKLCKDTI